MSRFYNVHLFGFYDITNRTVAAVRLDGRSNCTLKRSNKDHFSIKNISYNHLCLLNCFYGRLRVCVKQHSTQQQARNLSGKRAHENYICLYLNVSKLHIIINYTSMILLYRNEDRNGWRNLKYGNSLNFSNPAATFNPRSDISKRIRLYPTLYRPTCLSGHPDWYLVARRSQVCSEPLIEYFHSVRPRGAVLCAQKGLLRGNNHVFI